MPTNRKELALMRQDAYRRRKSGESVESIAQLYNRSKRTVYKWLQREENSKENLLNVQNEKLTNVKTRKNDSDKKILNKKNDSIGSEIYRLNRKGWTTKRLSRKFNITKQMVYQYCQIEREKSNYVPKIPDYYTEPDSDSQIIFDENRDINNEISTNDTFSEFENDTSTESNIENINNLKLLNLENNINNITEDVDVIFCDTIGTSIENDNIDIAKNNRNDSVKSDTNDITKNDNVDIKKDDIENIHTSNFRNEIKIANNLQTKESEKEEEYPSNVDILPPQSEKSQQSKNQNFEKSQIFSFNLTYFFPNIVMYYDRYI